MKVLFYGGCHAQVLRRIFREFADGNHEYHELINFVRIAAGEPFPYEMLPGFDWVVFSPIVNQPGYNTASLPEHCRGLGVRTLSFPWLQWSGYFPGIAKGASPLGCDEWHYPHLAEQARRAASLEAFERQVYDGWRDAAEGEPDSAGWVRGALAETSDRLARRERECGIDLPVSQFIDATWRRVRLFLTPDHPSIALYRVVAAGIAERLGIALDRSLAYTAWEPQAAPQTPILPSVHHHLGLPFTGGDYAGTEGGGSLSLQCYLRQVYQGAHCRSRS